MNRKQLLIVVATLIFMISCTESKKGTETLKYVEEPHSYAQPNEAVITHLNLDIDVNFGTEVISGSASYAIDNNNASQIILDAKNLVIEKVQADGKDTEFSLGTYDESLGQPLNIKINGSTKNITVFYQTTDKTEAVQWLNPQQTADKTQPFLFTQGQAILTRTWIPIQDSPQIRITYDATVRVPKELMAVMSAENPKVKSPNGEYHFKMVQKIPPYLMALAVGDIAYKAVSNRTGVYAENSMVDAVQEEFSEMENMLVEAEKLYGKYAWDQFDVIVLPPSFPFGGMENPRLTFATPTLIAGDKSLTSVIAHELAHSWSGNLVTNTTWDDFWLNEGFTVYFENRIMEALYGKDRANMLGLIARQDLNEEIEGFKDTPEKTHLKLNLKGQNPDDGMNSIAYDKGFLFLKTLEETIGREKFDVFLKNYFQSNAFTTMTTEKFIVYLNENLLDKHSVKFNTDEWVYNPGIPSNAFEIKSDKFENVSNTIKEIVTTNKVNAVVAKDWTTQEWVYFIRNFPTDITPEQMALIDNAFDLTNSKNSHKAMVWYEQAINHNYKGNNVDMKIEEFLTRVGRRWYVSTLYKAFANADKVDEGMAIYKKARSNYHSVTVNTIDEVLGYKE
jgi:leukotriene-A4 hydrolase|tara:strand:+ start:551 stop:2407 length:1857 start_codon:yes stop_codon:yes gene_type:complete